MKGALPERHEARFWTFVVASVGCWRWSGRFASGYPIFDWAEHSTTAYRVAWGIANGEMPPKGLPFEHVCGWKWCVNPHHVRPRVARGDSGERWRWLAGWNERHYQCVNGHTFTRANSIEVPGGRACRQCRHEEERRRART